MGKRERIIEGTWDCSSCGKRAILARHPRCPGCNSVREAGGESSFDFGASDPATGRALREGVTDPAQLAAAAAGPDWVCEYCAAANRAGAERCRTCNAGRPHAPATAAPPPAAATTAGPADAPAPPARPEPPAWWTALGGCLSFLVLVSCCGGLGYAGWWGQQKQEVTGTVVERAWQRELRTERFTRVTEQAWRDELRVTPARMPVSGKGEVAGVTNVRACKRAQRGTRQVADGTERVCTTRSRRVRCGSEERCSRQDLGNGYAKEVCEDVPKYCSEDYRDCENRTRYRTVPVYAERCSYDTWRWEKGAHAEAKGADGAPRWPELAVGPLDRVERKEAYRVTVEYPQGDGTKRHVVEPSTAEAFAAWPQGARVRMEVTNLGSVASASPTP